MPKRKVMSFSHKIDQSTHDALTAAFTQEPLSYSELLPLIDFAKEKRDYWDKIHAKLQVMSITQKPIVATWQLNVSAEKPKRKASKKK